MVHDSFLLVAYNYKRRGYEDQATVAVEVV